MTRTPHPPIDLRRHFVFLSASFPHVGRATGFPPSNPGAIADAVVAVARGVLEGNGRLVFGGHPTISPLVLMVARELSSDPASVVIYQSVLFRDDVTRETLELEREGRGEIRWVEAAPGETASDFQGNLESLRLMRQQLLRETVPVAAFFVGGMEGVVDERWMVAELCPRAVTVPIRQPGGAAGEMPPGDDLPALVREAASSPLFPVLVHAALEYLSTTLE